MDYADVLRELKALGTEQNRKTYKRHGIGDKMYGVSFANLNALKKKIKVDHELAQALWATGNHDARVLATMIADPAQMSDRLLEAWVKDLDNNVVTDSFSGLAGRTASVRKKMEKWTKAKGEWVARAGWHLLAHLTRSDADLPDGFFEPYLVVIERDIRASRNRVREAMNNTLIAIGLRNAALRQKAIAAAKRLGPIEVDHGETYCQTPYAVDYIARALAHQKKHASARA